MEEDKILCCAWLEVSQDPVKGANQRKEKLWERIACLYKERKPNYNSGARTTKSLQCRMALINKAINKFRGCVRSVERQHPSGASEIDIVSIFVLVFFFFCYMKPVANGMCHYDVCVSFMFMFFFDS